MRMMYGIRGSGTPWGEWWEVVGSTGTEGDGPCLMRISGACSLKLPHDLATVPYVWT